MSLWGNIYSFQCSNKEETLITYEKIYNGKVNEQTEILKRFESNVNIRNEFKIKSGRDKHNDRENYFPCDLIIDPLHFVQSSIG